ncbi:WD40 repeat-like protein [Gymnopus androsaceus JB14]|uniref:WD40 repeat-like protein n=1 Tax=Gymnopus androsaceus JB14 TaxID=1447944 RepID=A0A6A4GMV0_9AGAR|nr:WD40 repeat-like protein [Gymnopus androsaceus JB14]
MTIKDHQGKLIGVIPKTNGLYQIPSWEHAYPTKINRLASLYEAHCFLGQLNYAYIKHMFQNNHIMRIWDTNTGAQIGDPLHGHDDTVFSVAFASDGTRIVSGSSDKTVRIWDANTGAQIGDPLHGHDDTVFSMVCSPNGTRIPSGSEDNIVRIWDTTTGIQLQGHDHLVRHAPNNTIYGSMVNSLPTFRS